MTAALWEALAATVAAVAIFLGGVYVGRMAPELKDAKAIIQRDAQNAKQESTDAERINAEAKQLAAAELDPIPAPVVRVRLGPPAACVPRATPAGSVPHASAPVPAGGAPGPLPAPGPVDIGEPLVRVGHDADAQVEALQDYIEHVCRVKAP